MLSKNITKKPKRFWKIFKKLVDNEDSFDITLF